MQGLPLAHYFEISLYRIQPGKEGDFADFIAARKTAKDGVNMDRPEIAYQVISGAPPQTFIFLAPLDSLSSLDEGLPRLPVYPGGRQSRWQDRDRSGVPKRRDAVPGGS